MESSHAILRFTNFATVDFHASNESLYAEPLPLYDDTKNVLFRIPLAVYASTLAWLAWRSWTFTIFPLFYPNRPKVYPYSIPWLGHSLRFVFNADKTLDEARRYFGNTRKPFTFVLGGKNVHMITSAKDTTAVFKSPEKLTFDTYIQDMMLRFGISQHGVDTTWHSSSAPGSRDRTLFKTMESTMKKQLNPGNEMKKLEQNLLCRINENLTWARMPDSSTQGSHPSEKVVPLLKWSQQCLLRSVTTAFYGEAIFKVEPEFLEIFSNFDDNGWKLPYRVPARFSQDMLKPKEAAQRAFRRYFDLPKSERADACWMVHEVEAEMRTAGITTDDISTFLLMVYWGVNTNAWKAAFWMLASIIANPILKISIEQEIFPYTQANPPLSPAELQEKLEQCPLLTAAYNETLRLFTSSTAARDVKTECVIGGVTLEEGSRLVIPYRQMQFDEEVFGANASQFDPARFFLNPSLAKHPSFRPYGGGLAYCPGRFIAQKEITYFNAMVLSKFHVELNDPNSLMPRMNTTKPCAGVVQVESGDEMVLRVRERAL
ncbi:cytochrome P450 [Phaeosphaeria sp. MPI-PUGE-AT-0046c]|nr:cytochrome P450 [Phaeosphaeria sp. MPI-PUGE-AT-0046c]